MNLRRKLAFFMALNRYVEIIVSGVPPLSLSKAKADSLTSVKAYGGLLQGGVPSGYTAVEYVQNATRTLVPTDFIPVGVTSVKVDLMTTASLPSAATGRTFYIFQARETTATTIFGISGAQSSLAISGSGTNNAITSSVTRTNGNKYRIVWEAKNGTQTLTVDDLTAETTDTKTNTYTTIADVNSPMCLFGNAGTLDPSGTATEVNRIYQGAQVYYAKMWANGKLVLDLVPAKRNSDNAVGLYNRVNGAFFTATEGSLTAGNEIVPTPSDPLDFVCNNGALKILGKSDWTIFTNPTYITGQGVWIDTNGKWKAVSDNGAGCAIPLTIGKQYTMVIHKKTTELGTMLRYGQSPQATPTSAGIQLTDWYRGGIADGQMVSFIAKQPYLVMQLSAVATEAGMVQEAIEVLEAQGGDYTFVDYVAKQADELPKIITAWKPDRSKNIHIYGDFINTSTNANARTLVIGSYAEPTSNSSLSVEVWRGSYDGSSYVRAFRTYAKSSVNNAGAGIPINHQFGENEKGFFDVKINGTTGALSQSVTVNGTTYSSTGTLQAVGETSTEYACLFNDYRTTTTFSPYSFKIGRVVAEEDGVKVLDLIPAIRNSDSVVGFYDAVSGTFLTNQGTGTLVAGQVIGDGEVLKLTPSNDTAGVANLFAVNTYKDVQEIITGVTTHKVGVYVFNGTEDWIEGSTTSLSVSKTLLGTSTTVLPANSTDIVCTHYQVLGTASVEDAVWVGAANVNFRVRATYATISDWKTFLAAQYTAGTPVILVYPLATAQDEVAPIPQTMQVVAGDNVLDIVQAGMSGLEVEAIYTKAKY